MPVVANLRNLIQEPSSSNNRLVVLIDQAKSLTVYTRFSYPYDHQVSISAVSHLFDETVDKLSFSAIEFYEDRDLPIVQYVGMYEKTLVKKSLSGEITIADATNNNVEKYMGLG